MLRAVRAVLHDVVDVGCGGELVLRPRIGVAHGFEAETEVLLLYLVDAYYTGEDEFGLAWNDPDLAIAWPNPQPLLSERDRSNPSLTEVMADPPR